MRLALRFALAVLAAGCAPAFGVEFVNKPIRVNPASDRENSINESRIVDDEKGGFGVFWSQNIDADPNADALFARFYDAKLKAVGKAQRFDGRIDGVATQSVYFGQPLHLGKGAIFAPYAGLSDLAAQTPTAFVAQLFSGGKTDGKPKVVTRDAKSFNDPSQLRDGRGVLYWSPGGAGIDPTGVAAFVAADGKVGEPFSVMDKPGYGGSFTSLDRGFFSSVVLTDGSIRTSVQVYDPKGGPDSRFVVSQAPSFDTFGYPAVVGLETGDILAVPAYRQPDGRYQVFGQLFKRSGQAKGKKPKLLLKTAPASPFVLYLRDGGFLILTFADNEAGSKLTAYRFDKAMKAKGKASTMWPEGARFYWRSALLSDGRVAFEYRTKGQGVFVQVLKP